MKNVCIMKDNVCWAILQIDDQWTIEDTVYTGFQKDAKYVPAWVWGSWVDNGDGSWTDPNGFTWDKDGYTTPDCITVRTPNYEGDWPHVKPSQESSETSKK